VTEKNFNLLNSLTTSLRVREEKLDCSQDAEGSEEEEESVLDVAKRGRNKEADGEVELVKISKEVKISMEFDVPASYR